MGYERRHPDPVFMYGALRSGTTLLRLMLLQHSRIHSPGEADYLFDHLSPDPAVPLGVRCDRAGLAADWKFKLADLPLPQGPENADLVHALNDVIHDRAPDGVTTVSVHRSAVFMARLFPRARVIHLLRDPRDSARSAVGMGWDGNSYHGVRHWLDTETAWDAADIPPDQVLTVRFEELIRDLEAGLTEICAFMGLEFEPAMLDYHKVSTYAPPDPKISQKWRTEASPREIGLIQGRVGPLLEARGYDSVGGAVAPGAAAKTWLRIDDKARRWRYNIRRYGLGLWLSQHAARALRLRGTADRLAARQLDIKIQNLK